MSFPERVCLPYACERVERERFFIILFLRAGYPFLKFLPRFSCYFNTKVKNVVE